MLLSGYPNVGKSSVINGLMGKKVVSISRTPGHTKHFQTIFLTDNVKLCDCPGLVFPSTAPRSVQVSISTTTDWSCVFHDLGMEHNSYFIARSLYVQ